MDSNAKSIVSKICLIAVYILLSMIGVYYAVGLVLFPIIAIPLTVYFIRHQLNIKQHISIQLIINIGIYIITGNFICVLVYLVSVCIPAYTVFYFYKQECPLPNIIMYVTLCLSTLVLIFFVLMKYLGIDFEAQYIDILNSVKQISSTNIKEWMAIQNPTLSQIDIEQLSLEMKELINSVVEAMKSVYAGLVILQLLITTSISVIVVNIILRRKDRKFPSLRELFDFRLSKIAVLILFISMFTIISNGNESASWSIIGLNIAFFLMTLFQIVGALALLAIVSKANIGKGIKVVGCIVVFILLSLSPYIVMIFGCLDTLFNYRKVKIVV